MRLEKLATFADLIHELIFVRCMMGFYDIMNNIYLLIICLKI